MSEVKVKDLMVEMAKDPKLKKRFVENPRGVLAERGIEVPEGMTVKVLEDSDNVRHIVLPHFPSSDSPGAQEMEKRILKSMGYVVP